jgi:L-asparaginase
MKVEVLVTGGTIDGMDKESYPAEEMYTLVPRLLETMQPPAEYSVEIMMIKDSSFITDEDRQAIYEKCKSSPEERIVITHGTDTMVRTAKFMDSHNLGKTIVLTGAFIPADKENSDASGNLNEAFEAAQTLPQGVYVAMAGQVFKADNVRKNFETKTFEKERA